MGRVFSNGVRGLGEVATRGASVLKIVGIVSVLFLISLLIWKKSFPLYRRRIASKGEGVWFYHRMLRLLVRQGFIKKPGQTPLEFAVEIGSSAPLYTGPVEELTSWYYRLRYGGLAPERLPWEQIEGALRLLKRTKG